MDIDTAEFPPSLHKKIMRRVWIIKYHTYIVFGTGIFSVLFLLSAWDIIAKINEAGTMGAISDLFYGFDMSFSFFSDLVSVFFIGTPALPFSALLLSLGLGGYFWYISLFSRSFRKPVINLNK